jgi:hypothetical protein
MTDHPGRPIGDESPLADADVQRIVEKTMSDYAELLKDPERLAAVDAELDDLSDVPVDAVRAGPSEFLLAAQRVDVGLVFVVAGDQFEEFEVVGEPTNIGGDRYLAIVRGPAGELRAQLTVGHRVN